MKKTVLWLLLVFLSFTSILYVTPKPLAADSESADIQFGINYYATNNHYEVSLQSDETYNLTGILERDFELFQNQGLKFVILEAVWAYHERTEGTYNEGAVNDLIRVCDIADDYGLDIIIDFHTRMSENSWTMPTWIENRKFETVFYNDTVRQAWLDFLGHIAEGLNDVENLVSWQMMNEPGWENTLPAETFADSWVNLWTDMRAVFKNFSIRPVSIRFDEALVRSDYFNRDSRINDICDYISFNWYIQTGTVENLNLAVSYAKEQNHRIMISEFGTDTGDNGELVDDAGVTDQYLASLDLFRDLGVDECAAFFWRADFNTDNPKRPGTEFNLAKDVNGTPRDAFYCLGDSSIFVAPESVLGSLSVVGVCFLALGSFALVKRKHK